MSSNTIDTLYFEFETRIIFSKVIHMNLKMKCIKFESATGQISGNFSKNENDPLTNQKTNKVVVLLQKYLILNCIGCVCYYIAFYSQQIFI